MKQIFSDINNIFKKRRFELGGIVLILFSILTELSFFTEAGMVGEKLEAGLKISFGLGRYLLPFFSLAWGVGIIYKSQVKIRISNKGVASLILFFAILISAHFRIGHPHEIEQALAGELGGGVVGGFFLYLLRMAFGHWGSIIIVGTIFLVASLLFTDKSLANIIEWFKEKWYTIVDWSKKQKNNLFAKDKSKKQNSKNKKSLFKKIIKGFKDKKETLSKKTDKSKQKKDQKVTNKKARKKEKKRQQLSKDKTQARKEVKKAHQKVASTKDKKSTNNKKEENTKSKVGNKQDQKKKEQSTEKQQKLISQAKTTQEYQLPPLSLLNQAESQEASFVNKTDILERTLDNFGVKAEITEVHCGPTITRYEIQPAPGVKVSKIVNLADDIALSLAASDVRIEAPIPGKAAVGIEVPNDEQALVTLEEVLASEEFQIAESKLTIGLGNDIAGHPVTANLSKMPHMLVAGATGSGKSVFINSIINSILHKATPKEVKFMLIDPKMVELTAYQGIPHLVSPVVTDPKKAATALRWIVKEMENRYELFAGSGARGIESYNQQVDGEGLPYMVVIIDELADLMMVSANEVEDAICRLAQKARAAGIHMILATQRPSVDVVTGVIKANIPTRVSFSLSSQADSRTILDAGGAEKLLGQGDMLFAPVGSNQPKRLQGAFISEAEVKRMVEFVKGQAKPDYADQIAEIKDSKVDIELSDEKDELYEDAVKLVVNNRASISFLQRKLSIGYNRAARMIDKMEEENIVGPHQGSKAREVLISEEELEEILNK
ncbi:DNA translocase FtsK [Halanaerocella petrolearia]